MTIQEIHTEPRDAGEIDVIDADRWPDVARRPNRAVRAAIARRLVRAAVDRLALRVELHPTGEMWGAGGPDSPMLRLVRPDAVFDRLGDSGLIGFGEAYMAGDLVAGHRTDSPAAASQQLLEALTLMSEHLEDLFPRPLHRLRRLAVRRAPATEANTPTGARQNIARHYDLSNDLFASFLDASMTYSSALFDSALFDTARFDGAPGAMPHAPTWADLEAAQHRKIDRLLDACGVGEGTSLLEIGTGWGELSLRAAQRGARVRTITLSHEQQGLARRRIAAAGLGDRVSVELCDYRSVSGRYDAVVSVEMVEAVGEAYWPAYFDTLRRVVADDGVIGLQAITLPHDRLLQTRQNHTFVHKYIFPGSLVPSVEALGAAASDAGLTVTDDLAFGLHYAETLRLWRQRFEERVDDLDRFGDDVVFRRMWTFYLAYAEAGFRSRYLDVHQLVMRPRPIAR